MSRKDLVEGNLIEQGFEYGYYKHVYLPDFARDIVLYGRSDSIGVLEAYDLTAEDFSVIAKLPLFKAEVGNLQKRLADSDNAAVHIKAADLLDTTLFIMQSRLLSGDLKTKELIEIGKFLADVTGAKVVQGKGDIIGPVNTGTVVRINYGQDLSKVPIIPEGEPVNETYTKIKHLYNVTDPIVDVEEDR